MSRVVGVLLNIIMLSVIRVPGSERGTYEVVMTPVSSISEVTTPPREREREREALNIRSHVKLSLSSDVSSHSK